MIQNKVCFGLGSWWIFNRTYGLAEVIASDGT